MCDMTAEFYDPGTEIMRSCTTECNPDFAIHRDMDFCTKFCLEYILCEGLSTETPEQRKHAIKKKLPDQLMADMVKQTGSSTNIALAIVVPMVIIGIVVAIYITFTRCSEKPANIHVPMMNRARHYPETQEPVRKTTASAGNRVRRELSRLSIPSLHTIRTPSVSINGLNVQSAISDPVPRSEAGMTEHPRDAIPIAVVHPDIRQSHVSLPSSYNRYTGSNPVYYDEPDADAGETVSLLLYENRGLRGIDVDDEYDNLPSGRAGVFVMCDDIHSTTAPTHELDSPSSIPTLDESSSCESYSMSTLSRISIDIIAAEQKLIKMPEVYEIEKLGSELLGFYLYVTVVGHSVTEAKRNICEVTGLRENDFHVTLISTRPQLTLA